MAKLEDIRKALRGGDSPADIPPEKSRGLDREKMRRKRDGNAGKYTMSINGTDATLHFGRWQGSSVSDMARGDEGRSYLNYIWREFKNPFYKNLREAVKYQLKLRGYPPEEV